jgi:monoamine oxidase
MTLHDEVRMPETLRYESFGRAMTARADRVVIVGAGLSGLVTAYELQRRGIRSLILEAGDRIGGRNRTCSFADGVTAEAHIEEFWEAGSAYELLRRLGLPLIERPAFSSVVLNGRLRRYIPGDAHGVEALFDVADRAGFRRWNEVAQRVLEQLLPSRHRSDVPSVPAVLSSLRQVSFASHVDSLRLPPDVASWIRVMVEAEIAVEWHQISALDGIAEMRPFATASATGRGEMNVAVVGGNSRLVDGLVAALPVDTVRTGSSVERVVDNGSVVDVHYCDAAGRRRVERGSHVVLAIPVWSIGHIAVDPPLNALARLAINSARAGSYVKTVLRVGPGARAMWNACWQEPFALLSDGPAGCIYLGNSPAEGTDLVLTALAHGRWARALNGRPSSEIADRTMTAIDRLLDCHLSVGRRAPVASIRSLVTDMRVFDCPKAVAYWPHGLGRSRFDPMAESLRVPHGRVLVAGDTSESSHSDGAATAAMRAVATIATRLGATQISNT